MTIPCIKYDQPGTADKRLRTALSNASALAEADLGEHLHALYDYNGQLWATWRSDGPRRDHAVALTRAWCELAGDARVVHLVSVDEQYDYQEDVLDNVAQAE